MLSIEDNLIKDCFAPFYVMDSHTLWGIDNKSWSVGVDALKMCDACRIVFVRSSTSVVDVESLSVKRTRTQQDVKMLSSSFTFTSEGILLPDLSVKKLAPWVSVISLEDFYKLSNERVTIYYWNDWLICYRSVPF